MRAFVISWVFLLAACERPVQVSTSGFGAFEPALARFGDGLAVAWYDNRQGNDEIYLRLLDADLRPRTAELRLTHSPDSSYEAALADSDGAVAVAWYDKDPAGTLGVKVGRWSAQGAALWETALTAPERNGRVPVLESVGERLFVAWIEEADSVATASIMGIWLDKDGNILDSPFSIAAASPTTWNLNSSVLPDGHVALVFDAEHETASSELYLAVVADSSSTLMRLSDDDGFASKYPDMAVSGSKAALTWFDNRAGNNEVYFAVADLSAFSEGSLQRIERRITETAGDSVGAYLAWNGARVGLTWNDDYSGQHQIYFRDFDAAGQPLGPVRQVTTTSAASRIPAIVAHGAGFALVWSEITAQGGHGGGQGEARAEIMSVLVQ